MWYSALDGKSDQRIWIISSLFYGWFERLSAKCLGYTSVGMWFLEWNRIVTIAFDLSKLFKIRKYYLPWPVKWNWFNVYNCKLLDSVVTFTFRLEVWYGHSGWYTILILFGIGILFPRVICHSVHGCLEKGFSSDADPSRSSECIDHIFYGNEVGILFCVSNVRYCFLEEKLLPDLMWVLMCVVN